MAQRQPGKREQQLLHDDPHRLKEAQDADDRSVDASIEERQSVRLRHEFRVWWQGLAPEEALARASRRDELLALLNEKYGYAREEAESEIDDALRALEQRKGAAGGNPPSRPV
jgi:hypothetical protein